MHYLLKRIAHLAVSFFLLVGKRCVDIYLNISQLPVQLLQLALVLPQ